MSLGRGALGLIAVVAATGCQSSNQLLADRQPTAIAAALAQARVGLDCPSVTGVVTSSTMYVPPPRARGEPALDYLVQVSGCGRSNLYLAVCPVEGTGCVAEISPTPGPLGV